MAEITREKALAFIESLKTLRESADDKLASIAPSVYPDMKYDNSLIHVGTRINWNGQVKKASVDLWDTEQNNPDNAPTLWMDLNYINGIRIIPAVITVAEAFAKDELGYWKGVLYKSLLNSNVYTPETYPAGWVMQQ